MSWNDKAAGENDPVVAQALRNFKSSVDAWCEAEMSRPRTAVMVAHPGWRMAAGWALGCVLAAASAAGAVYERQHKQELARIAAAQAAAQRAAQERLVAQQRTASMADQDLLATVDSDISRAVPAAMEPLAQMMDEKQADGNGTQQ